MNWEAIGAIGITLLFLTVQLRQNTKSTNAATTQASLDAEMTFQTMLIRHADVWERVVMGGDTSEPVATRRAVALYNMVMTLNDNRFQMQSEGYLELPEEAMRQIVEIPFFEIWRGSIGAASRSQRFLEYVDSLRHQEAAGAGELEHDA